MDVNEFQSRVMTTAIFEEAITSFVDSLEIKNDEKRKQLHNLLNVCYAVLGYMGEVGELGNKLKKVIRDDGCDLRGKNGKELPKELGDSYWYGGATADVLNTTMSEIMQNVLDKLQDRRDRGVIRGSGDNR